MASNKGEYTVIDLANFRNNKVVCLTLDVEQDYGELLDEPSYEGLQHIPELVEFFKERNISLTCFVQGSLFETHPARIKQLSALDVEFELHSYSHPEPKEANVEFEVERGKEAYRRFVDKDPVGYRSPLGVINGEDYAILASNGFRFDCSIFPSVMPGVFNNLRKPTKPYLLNNSKMIELPFTVLSNAIRIPIALSYIKLFGKPYFYLLKTFHLPNLIIFNFHLHDLFELSSSNKIALRKFSPIYRLVYNRIYRKQKNNGFAILDELITTFQRKGYMFSKLLDIYQSIIRVEGNNLFRQD